MNLRTILTDAKKAAGAVVVGAGAAVTAGLIDNAQAAVITGAAGVVTAVVVYLLANTSSKPPHVAEHDLAPGHHVYAAKVANAAPVEYIDGKPASPGHGAD